MASTTKRTRTRAHAGAKPRAKKPSKRRWSAAVTAKSNALDLEPGVFKKNSPQAIAVSLQRSAERSRRRKSSPYRSAMSMLNFQINRAGRGLSSARRALLERAKAALRKLYHRDAHA